MNKNSSEISKLMFSTNEKFKSCPTVIPGQVRIIHGKGTGLLRQGIHSHLKRLSYVKSYRLGVFGEGDSGVTIVELK